MQTQEEVERICYDVVLAQAERHMDEGEPRTCGTCRDCSHCTWGIDHMDVSAALAEVLAGSVGICDGGESLCIVELDSEHDEGCWEERA